MTKLEVYKELFRNHHVLHFNKELKITNKFTREFCLQDMQEEQEKATERTEVAVVKPTTDLIKQEEPSGEFKSFKVFILEADIPAKLYLSNGGHYWANRYNAKADTEFKKIAKRGIRYDVLLTATKLYYKSGGARETIANFILNGSWESFYDDMLANLEKGTVKQHITKNISDGDEGYSRYK